MNRRFIDILKEELRKPLPGKEAHLFMAPDTKKLFNIQVTSITIKSSILIPIFLRDKEFHTVLFKRPENDRYHAGQVCFPGGKFEKEDSSLEETAIREAWEEIGIERNKVTVIGSLSPLHIPVSNYLVYPYIGYLSVDPIFRIDPDEVKELIVTPIRWFMDEKNIKEKTIEFQGQEFLIPYFFINNFEIWGATAMIISEWIEILKRPNFQQTSLYNVDNAQ